MLGQRKLLMCSMCFFGVGANVVLGQRKLNMCMWFLCSASVNWLNEHICWSCV